MAKQFTSRSNSNTKIFLIFTRDFSLATCEIWQEVLIRHLPRLVGRGMHQQIIRFNGKAIEAYRSVNEDAVLERTVTSLPLTHRVFRPSYAATFRNTIVQTRRMLTSYRKNHRELTTKSLEDLDARVTNVWCMMMLSNMLPHAWKDSFMRTHPTGGQTILNSFYRLRKLSQGFIEEVDGYWLDNAKRLLRKRKLPEWYARLLRRSELRALVRGGRIPNSQVFEQRRHGYVLFGLNTVVHSSFNTFLKKRHQYIQPLGNIHSTTLNGTVAMAGRLVRARAQIVLNRDDVARFSKRRILVTTMTTPDFLPIMKQASAIVTDEGGITCHAAIVSRELRIPCVIGTKIATKIIKNGDRVEVDANRGIVRLLKRG
ncbi:MAG: PEP-utilizing enzyme [Candidatus Kerfeldbacteria bacterium]